MNNLRTNTHKYKKTKTLEQRKQSTKNHGPPTLMFMEKKYWIWFLQTFKQVKCYKYEEVHGLCT